MHMYIQSLISIILLHTHMSLYINYASHGPGKGNTSSETIMLLGNREILLLRLLPLCTTFRRSSCSLVYSVGRLLNALN